QSFSDSPTRRANHVERTGLVVHNTLRVSAGPFPRCLAARDSLWTYQLPSSSVQSRRLVAREGQRIARCSQGRAEDFLFCVHDFCVHDIGEADAVVFGPDVAKPMTDIASEHERV